MNGRTLSMDDLFPPEGHRYFTDERIEGLRQLALHADTVPLPSLTMMELICDWRNMVQELASLGESD